MYKRILVAIDGSEHSIRAAEQGAHFAQTNEGSTVEVLYVIDPQKSRKEVLRAHDQVEMDEKRTELLNPATIKLTENNVPYELKVLHGDAAHTITDHANRGEFDLVIIGSRGLNMLQKVVLGSVSDKAIRGVKTDVLIVK